MTAPHWRRHRSPRRGDWLSRVLEAVPHIPDLQHPGVSVVIVRHDPGCAALAGGDCLCDSELEIATLTPPVRPAGEAN